jgi:hypothetical protein
MIVRRWQDGLQRSRPRRAACRKITDLLWLPLFLAILSVGVGADAPGNGLYAIAESGPVVKTLDGTEVHLGEKLNDTISKAVVRSVSNDNERYYLSLEKSGPFQENIATWRFAWTAIA